MIIFHCLIVSSYFWTALDPNYKLIIQKYKWKYISIQNVFRLSEA